MFSRHAQSFSHLIIHKNELKHAQRHTIPRIKARDNCQCKYTRISNNLIQRRCFFYLRFQQRTCIAGS